MSETTDILQGTINELEAREQTLTEEIERIQQEARTELRGVQKALRALRKQVGPNGSEPEAEPVTAETKDAVLRELEAKAQDGAGGARPSGIAKASSLNEKAVRAALAELHDSGDVEQYGKGLWRIK